MSMKRFLLCLGMLSLLSACDDDSNSAASENEKVDASNPQFQGSADSGVVEADADLDAELTPEEDADLGPAPEEDYEATPVSRVFDWPKHTASAPDYLLITSDALADSAAELLAWRQARGHEGMLYTVSDLVGQNIPTPEALRTAIHSKISEMKSKLSADEPLYLALLGDAPELENAQIGDLVAMTCENQLDDYCFTDNLYGDLDNDNLPDVAVGRIPARSAEQAAEYLAKLKEHETTFEPGLWNRRVSLYIGNPGMGESVDAILERIVMEALDQIDPAFDIQGLYKNSASAYFYMPFADKVFDMFRQGNLLTVYIGHGLKRSSTGVNVSNVDQIQSQHRLPISFVFACLTGDFIGEEDSLAEAMLWQPAGSINVFAASGTVHPLGNAVLAYELQRLAMGERPQTVGELSVALKRASIENHDNFRSLISNAATIAGVTAQEQALSDQQHLNLYNLLGDPATIMKFPLSDVSITREGSAREGTLKAKGQITTDDGHAFNGAALVTLESRRAQFIHEIEELDPDFPDPEVMECNWQNANNRIYYQRQVHVKDGRFSVDFTDQEPLTSSSYYLKVYAKETASEGVNLDGFDGIAVP